MSLPRPVFPGSTYMVTRRTTQRKFLLKPKKSHNEAWLYILAYAAKVSGVKILAFVANSNHHHICLFDPEGRVSIFMRELHRLVAKHHNASFGRFENFWSSEPPSLVRLEGPEDVLDKIVYTVSNPVKDHLVATAAQWPGAVSLPGDLCAVHTVARPKKYFRAQGSMPENLQLVLHKPPGFESMEASDFRKLVSRRVTEAERAAVAQRRERGFRVLGRRAVRLQHHEGSPSSVRAGRFGLKPRVASKSKWARVEALQRLKSFVAEYRVALSRWRAGERDVVFPYGTNMMRTVHRVRCRAAPS